MTILSILLLLVVAMVAPAVAQPRIEGDVVIFTYVDQTATSVALVGDFNGWSKNEDLMARRDGGRWVTKKKLGTGTYEYKFVIDDERYINDPGNPATVPNYNNSAQNSIFVITPDGQVHLTATPPALSNPKDIYPATPDRKPLLLNIIWHQHQPLYVNPETDQLTGPWVRTHGTKDYYDMAAMLKGYPEIHCTINLTSSLILQLQRYYVDRLGPFIDVKRGRMDVEGFLAKWKGKTDPWIDLALKPTAQFDSVDRSYLYRNSWSAFGISEVMLGRFPEYQALWRKLPPQGPAPDGLFTEQEEREIKFWFYLAYFDPDFLRGPVNLSDGSVVDLSSYIEERSDGTFYLKKKVSEDDCVRMVIETYKVMANILPVHRDLRQAGQIEVITTPYYHPILPLVYDTDLAHECQPTDRLPARFSYPVDASAQVAKAVKMYRQTFGSAPTGMWPGEGAVAQPVLSILRDNGILWTASDVKVLTRSDPPNQPNNSAYSFPAPSPKDPGRKMSLVFRDTELSDRIGFTYQNYKGEEAAEDFVQSILARAPRKDEPDALLTVILDGENAWEWYRKDIDGKEFLHAFYRKLSALYKSGRVITVTVPEYMEGNKSRGVSGHPVEQQPSMRHLWPGSWINANYDTWIGEEEENSAWEALLTARKDLAASGISQPDPKADPPAQGTRAWYGWMAWEEMYAAEGSDWFWWYGTDQTAPGGDMPFDTGYRIHLKNIYRFAGAAGAKMPAREFQSFLRGETGNVGQGTMSRSRPENLPDTTNAR